MKTCIRCEEAKPTEDFVKRAERPSGYANHCKACGNKRQNELRAGATPSTARHSWGYGWTDPDHLKPTQRPTTKDICFAAGFYEGDGSCQSGGYVQISQKDPEVLHKLRAFFGGKILKYKASSGLYYYKWCVSGPRGRGFLLTIYSLMTTRRQTQIKEALLCA